MHFYDLVMGDESRWQLAIERKYSDGTPVDIWAHIKCEKQDESVVVPFYIDGQGGIVDFNPTAFCSTVISKKMADILMTIAPNDIQLLPAVVEGSHDWFVLNVLSCIDCIDHAKSIIEYYPPDHHEKPNKPRMVVKLVLDTSIIGPHHIFKPKDWRVADIVSEDVKAALERENITGIEYWPVA